MTLNRIQLLIAFGPKEGIEHTELMEFANRVNKKYVMIRTTVTDTGAIYFDHDICVDGGVPKKNIVLLTKRFANIPRMAVQDDGKDLF